MSHHVPRADLLATVVMPAGTYYLGDPCYSVPNSRWMEWLEAAKYETEDVLVADLDGHKILGLSTLYGDGQYPGSNGFDYPVDAGLIGLVPVSMAYGNDCVGRPDLVTKVTFDKPVVCQYERGLLRFGHITIDTRD